MNKAWCLLLLVLLLSSCARKVYVPVETVRVDTLVKLAVRVDSVRLTDSVYVSEKVVGDTVFIVRTRTQWRERVKLVTDTVYRSRVDTVTKVVEVPVKDEKLKIKKWWVAALLLGAALLSLRYFRR